MQNKLLFLVCCITILLGGCSFWKEKADPNDTYKEYVESFTKLDYEKMYALISKESLEKNDYNKEDFISKYKTIFNGIEASNITSSKKELKYNEDSGIYTGEFSIKMNTFIKELEVTYTVRLEKKETKEGDKWVVNWNPSLILPGMAKGDKIRVATSHPKRGKIVDNHNRPIAVNGEAFELGIVPSKLNTDKDKNIKQISEYFDVPMKKIEAALNQKWVKPDLFVPITILPVKFQPGNVLEEIEGIAFQRKEIRQYPLGETAAHLVGYVQRVSAEDIEKDKEGYYTASDWIGKAGLERTFESKLRGQKGGIIEIVDKDGNGKHVLKEVEAVDGEDVALTINADLQSNLYSQFKGEAGAVSAMNPKTGELLALVSFPSYDPNLMVTGMSQKQWKSYNEDPMLPFLARYATTYAPGSTFKAITASIGLSTGVTTPEKKRTISGLQWKKDSSWGGYYVTRVKDANIVNMIDALVYSDNIYFAQEALEMGASTFQENAIKYGFNEEFDLPINVKDSQLANNEIKNEVLLADSAYGQGEVLMSPIHLGVAFTPFINGGDLVMPKLLPNQSTEIISGLISTKVAFEMKNALTEVVSRSNGTAHNLYSQNHKLAAKTGTAELKKAKGEDGLENGFLVVFDTEQKEIILTAVVEDVKGRGGSHLVAEKVKPVLNNYLRSQMNK